MVIYSYTDIITIYYNIENSIDIQPNYYPLIATCALHIYHIIWYFNKLRFDDWLHHILMIFVLIPISLYINVGLFTNHALFFISGLPGAIDYLLLFLNRNNWIKKITEKSINCFLNLWIRAPGCVAHAVLSIQAILIKLEKDNISTFNLILSLICVALVYWNGIYFMNQVVQTYAIQKFKYRIFLFF